jgi:hypothetical protein
VGAIARAEIALAHPIIAAVNFIEEEFDADREFYRTKVPDTDRKYSTKDLTTGVQGHLAYDMQDRHEDPRIFAGVEGRFHRRQDEWLGNMAMVEHASGLWLTSCHVAGFAVADGALVEPDTHVADIGETGKGASSPHNHFTVLAGGEYGRFRDPTWMLNECKEALMLIDPKTGLLDAKIAAQIDEMVRDNIARAIGALALGNDDKHLFPEGKRPSWVPVALAENLRALHADVRAH